MSTDTRARVSLEPSAARGLRQATFVLLCISTFFVPWEELLIIPGFITGTFLASSLALGTAAIAVLSRTKMAVPPVPLLFLGLFALWSFISLLWTIDAQQTLGAVVTYTSLLLFTWMLCEFVDTKARLLTLLRSYLAGCCVAMAMLFESFIVGRQTLVADTTRYTGGGLNPNSYALLISIGIVIAAYMSTTSRSRGRTVYWLFIMLAAVSVLPTGSRAGTIGLIAALVAALAVTWSGNTRAMLPLMLALACSVWLVSNMVPSALLERVTEGTGAGTFALREEQWRLGLEVWDESPLIGAGANAFITAVTERGGRALVAHNTFVQILTENGAVGLGLLLVSWFLLLKRALRLPHSERILWLGAVLVWTICAMVTNLNLHKITWLLYAWIMVEHAVPRASSSDAVSASIMTASTGAGISARPPV